MTLWNALKNPPEAHPIYERIVHQEAETTPWYVLLAEGTGLLLFVPILMFTTTLYGLTWVVTISRTIARDQHNGLLSLMKIQPAGPFVAIWLTATACLHRNRIFENITTSQFHIGRSLFIGVILFGVMQERIPAQSNTEIELALLGEFLAAAIALMVGLLLDHIQTIIISVLVGTVIPLITNRADVQIASFSVFLFLQVIVYALVVFSIVIWLPARIASFDLQPWLQNVLVYTTALLLMVSVRALIIAVLWRVLLRSLNDDAALLDFPHATRV